MRAQELEQDVYEPPVINPWRTRPSHEQIRFAIDLCHTELPEPQPVIESLRAMSGQQVSRLISGLTKLRAERLHKAPRSARWRLAPMGRRR